MSVYQQFIYRKPACFGPFELADATDVKSGWGHSPEFLTKYVRCGCGEERLNIYASSGNNMRLAPIILECPTCQARAEVFHPDKHGYDGQLGQNCAMVGETPPELVAPSPGRIVVEYSYQGKEHYEELLEEGIENPEDYFDVFSIYTADDRGKLTEVTSCECA